MIIFSLFSSRISRGTCEKYSSQYFRTVCVLPFRNLFDENFDTKVKHAIRAPESGLDILKRSSDYGLATFRNTFLILINGQILRKFEFRVFRARNRCRNFYQKVKKPAGGALRPLTEAYSKIKPQYDLFRAPGVHGPPLRKSHPESCNFQKSVKRSS